MSASCITSPNLPSSGQGSSKPNPTFLSSLVLFTLPSAAWNWRSTHTDKLICFSKPPVSAFYPVLWLLIEMSNFPSFLNSQPKCHHFWEAFLPAPGRMSWNTGPTTSACLLFSLLFLWFPPPIPAPLSSTSFIESEAVWTISLSPVFIKVPGT